MDTPHDATAKRIAAKHGVEYNRGQGPDIQTPNLAIEVETVHTISDGFRQLQGFRKPVYIAGADDNATNAALAATEDRTVGVMDQYGAIRRDSTRR